MGNHPSGDDYVVDDKEVFQSYRIPQKAYKKKNTSGSKDAAGGSRSSKSSSINSSSTHQPTYYHFTSSQRLAFQQFQQQQKLLQQHAEASYDSGEQPKNGDDTGAGTGEPFAIPVPRQGQLHLPQHLPNPRSLRSGSLHSSLRSSHRGRPSSFPSRNSSCSSLDLSIIHAALEDTLQQEQEQGEFLQQHPPQPRRSFARRFSDSSGKSMTTTTTSEAAAMTTFLHHPNYPLLPFGPQNPAALESTSSLHTSSIGGHGGLTRPTGLESTASSFSTSHWPGHHNDLDNTSEHDHGSMPPLGMSLVGTGLGRATFIDGEMYAGYIGHHLTIQEFLSVQQQQQQQFLEHQQKEYQKMVMMQQRQQMILQQKLLQLQQQQQQRQQQQVSSSTSPEMSNSVPLHLETVPFPGAGSSLPLTTNSTPSVPLRAQRPVRNPGRLHSSPALPASNSSISSSNHPPTLHPPRRPRNNTHSGSSTTSLSSLHRTIPSSISTSHIYNQHPHQQAPQSSRSSQHSAQSHHHSHSHSISSSVGSSHHFGSSPFHQSMLAMTAAETGTSPPSSSSSSLSLSVMLPNMNVNGTVPASGAAAASNSGSSITVARDHSIPSKTLSSSIKLEDLVAKVALSHRPLSGREYHPDRTVPYLLPCDAQEGERLMLQHYVLRHAFGSNVIPPIDTTLAGKVLDCGCGPGTWVMEMAAEHEDLDFYGFDISPMYPSTLTSSSSASPPSGSKTNVHFSYGSLLANEIPFPSNTFLLVHQRNLLLGLPKEAWPAVLADLFRTVLPGGQGYLQLCEVDPNWCRPGPNTTALLQRLDQTAHLHHIDLLVPPNLDTLLANAGCQHVHMTMVEIPIGAWGGHLGLLWKQVLQAEIAALQPVVLQAALETQLARGADRAVVGAEMTTPEEWDHMMEAVWEETDQYRTFSRVYLAYGQKP
ncbi:hypothetical protein BGZ73_005773 [Actinomortierella ambigua]|nr:hypothetical protein BGZ73_005773 [Actinomortierella ambigua]